MQIAIINGPNLNMLGRRDKSIYGSASLSQIERQLEVAFPEVEFDFFQSNSEGALIDFIQTLADREDCIGLVINPGAYAHYSYALADALADYPGRKIEVHISNIAAREEFRNRSVTAPRCEGIISGLGVDGYRLAVEFLIGGKR